MISAPLAPPRVVPFRRLAILSQLPASVQNFHQSTILFKRIFDNPLRLAAFNFGKICPPTLLDIVFTAPFRIAHAEIVGLFSAGSTPAPFQIIPVTSATNPTLLAAAIASLQHQIKFSPSRVPSSAAAADHD